MDEADPADFYVGIVVDVYAALRGSFPDADTYSAFIARSGEPALELGCGDGDPLLTLREAGLDVEGLDSSVDMLAKLESTAARQGIDVTVHHSTIETMDLGRRYMSIFLAGPTFNLLPDDATASRALQRIAAHLEAEGSALIPLFVPEPVPERHLGRVREHVEGSGRILRVTATATERDELARTQTTTLRYEVSDDDNVASVEKPWLLHWYTQSGFSELATAAGLSIVAILGRDGRPASTDADELAFLLRATQDEVISR